MQTAEQRLQLRIAYVKKRIKFFLDNGTGCPELGTLLRWLERQYDESDGTTMKTEVISKAMAEMQSAKEIRIDTERRVWRVR